MKKNIDIKKAIQQIPVKELREFVEVQTGKNQKFQAAFLKHFEDFFVEKESGNPQSPRLPLYKEKLRNLPMLRKNCNPWISSFFFAFITNQREKS